MLFTSQKRDCLHNLVRREKCIETYKKCGFSGEDLHIIVLTVPWQVYL
jgi:hypothetical protein